VADSDALRARRYRQCRAGNHALCRHPQEPIRQLAVVPDGGEVDRRAVLVRLVRRLEQAHAADPGNAMVARELRAAVRRFPLPRRVPGMTRWGHVSARR
jgi:hypothetical protein